MVTELIFKIDALLKKALLSNKKIEYWIPVFHLTFIKSFEIAFWANVPLNLWTKWTF